MDAHDATIGVDAAGTADAADWSIPAWVRRPRLEGILGTRLADITWRHLESLVTRKVAEDLSIEYKQRHYVLDRGLGHLLLPTADEQSIGKHVVKGRFELAKDVTALANAGGGLIVIGVAEFNGRAECFAEVELKDHVRLAYLDTIRTWITPYLAGIEIGHVSPASDSGDTSGTGSRPASGGGSARGCVLIYVPSSADRPLAVGEPNSHHYTWYMRDGGHAVTLSETQIAGAYRDRYAGRADIERRVHTVFKAGVGELDRRSRVWLATALVPSMGADRRHLERRVLDEFTAHTHARQDSLPGPRLARHSSFGPGRIVLRDSPVNIGLATDSLLHLYLDGSAFAAIALDTLRETDIVRGRRAELRSDVQCIRVGSITAWTITLAGIACGHAVDAGAAGDLELVSAIVTATERDAAGDAVDPPRSLQHVVLDQPWRFASVEDMIPGTTWRTELTPVQVTAPAGVAGDKRELIALAAQLTSDLVAEFGQLPSDPLLTADGLVVGEHCSASRLEPFRNWAHTLGLLVEEQPQNE